VTNADPFARAQENEFEHLENRLPDDLIEELDKELDCLELAPGEEIMMLDAEGERADGLSADPGIRQMQETYLEMAKNALSPVSRYVKAISLGETSRELLEISEIVVTPLIPRTESVGLSRHAEDLNFFRSLIQLALGERDQTGSEAMREVVMEGFLKLAERFDLQFRGYRLAVRNLVEFYRALKKSDSVGEANIRRFFAVGVPSLTWVRRTRVAEMTSLSGIPMEVMTEIRRIASLYRSVPPMSSTLVREDKLAPKPRMREEDQLLFEAVIEDAAVNEAEVAAPVHGEA
jgi:hypothetical protein